MKKAKKVKAGPELGKRKAFKIFHHKVKPFLPIKILGRLDPRKKAFSRVMVSVVFEIAAIEALSQTLPKTRANGVEIRAKREVAKKAIKAMATEIRSGRWRENLQARETGATKRLVDQRIQQIMQSLGGDKHVFSARYGENTQKVTRLLNQYLKENKRYFGGN